MTPIIYKSTANAQIEFCSIKMFHQQSNMEGCSLSHYTIKKPQKLRVRWSRKHLRLLNLFSLKSGTHSWGCSHQGSASFPSTDLMSICVCVCVYAWDSGCAFIWRACVCVLGCEGVRWWMCVCVCVNERGRHWKGNEEILGVKRKKCRQARERARARDESSDRLWN